ncbi:class I SAM-dependent RNA methyltransferase [Plantactinospora soyae]|uniref:tRNA/tmRNA/rRNA uracil-C5-methylase (TrmA/RlmC/RlmD family) n=1 Tax=Plantactinospora soyae TaxID=1544732 RepID=A0A927M726_9ACTN|nr:TRAM domain-containing protein [Plantactinospora soyae]MBE1488075.1 tRNA/tmRNA/rRNA uracil-C5-methylase (TrmA/RlmC/RlmD family) [Plantactinospora soyae]
MSPGEAERVERATTGPGEAERVELTVGAVAHGGHCVARLDGQVVFVRHALPGERVIAEITEVRRDFLRADAVTVLEPSPDRVEPPCPYAGPDRCGGCDLQHVAPPAQRDWKAEVVREQLRRLARLDPAEVAELDVRVDALPGGSLGWRSRVRYAVDGAGRAGLLKHRSHEVVPIDRCLIAHPAIQDQPVLPASGRSWPDADVVEVIASSGGDVTVRPRRTTGLGLGGELGDAADPVDGVDAGQPGGDPSGGRTAPGGAAGPGAVEAPVEATGTVRELAVDRVWELPPEAFWQVHPAAADTLVAAVLDLLDPRDGESAWDLYGGAGLFAAALAGEVGPTGRITLVESAAAAVRAARQNLSDLPQIEVVRASVAPALSRRRIIGPVDLVVLDPPRAGAGAEVVRAVAAAATRAIAYVACDPASFARDVRTFREAGWRLAALRGFDLFPMTQHVELVSLLVPAAPTTTG